MTFTKSRFVATCPLVHPGRQSTIVVFALSSIGSRRSLPLVARLHDDLFHSTYGVQPADLGLWLRLCKTLIGD